MTGPGYHEVAEAFRLGDFLVRVCYEPNGSFGHHYLVIQREQDALPEPQTLLVHHVDDLSRIVKASEVIIGWSEGDIDIQKLTSTLDVIGAQPLAGDISLKRTEPPHYPEWVRVEAL